MTKIVVIEDNVQNARMADKLLKRAGYEVKLAEDGEMGLTAVFEEQPDLILIDLGLPDIDGQTVIGLVRQHETLKNVPLIAFTAWPPEEAHDMAKRYGCDGVITKPINTRTFAGQIGTFLKGQDGSTSQDVSLADKVAVEVSASKASSTEVATASTTVMSPADVTQSTPEPAKESPVGAQAPAGDVVEESAPVAVVAETVKDSSDVTSGGDTGTTGVSVDTEEESSQDTVTSEQDTTSELEGTSVSKKDEGSDPVA